jgi:hypothetical protein
MRPSGTRENKQTTNTELFFGPLRLIGYFCLRPALNAVGASAHLGRGTR